LKDLHNLYSSPDIIKETKLSRMRWMGHIVLIGDMGSSNRILFGKSGEEVPLRRPRCG
jgi:hypothetical protein